ncbi:MAG TPA: NAD+ synthase [Armatimonadota bacterium]|nr:NAD+ synthase [Armatimonadota bacterium]
MDNHTGSIRGSLRIALAQINPTVGDIEGNTDKIIDFIDQGRNAGADIIAFTELAITGYPPEDLLLKPSFLEKNLQALDKIIAASNDITTICGFVDVNADIYNAAAVIHNGKLAGVHRKVFLPNYGVFDEFRYFQKGCETSIFRLGGPVFGVSICEDMWYPDGPHRAQALAGAQVLININASPFYSLKWKWRDSMLTTRAGDNSAYVVYVNQVGGQDELVFDGHSMIIDPRAKLVSRGTPFEEELVVADLDIGSVWHTRLADPRWRQESPACRDPEFPVRLIDLGPKREIERPRLATKQVSPPERVEEVYKALVLGTRDYVKKNKFSHVVIGLSGGIDSALTAAVAVDALGPENVTGVSMPSIFTSEGTKTDAELLAKNLGINLITIPIQEVFECYKTALKPVFEGYPSDVTEENIQARIRGNYLMALSNKFKWLVLTTGNKSELATGYATLYGDMAGGFAVLKDVPKTLVYELSNYRNTISPVIPQTTIERPPSAELRPDQKDQDTLPPYELLDPILHLYIEQDASPGEIIAKGYPEDVVRRVIAMVDRNEYKRRQAAPGVKITPKAFGKDRRLPITNAFRE